MTTTTKWLGSLVSTARRTAIAGVVALMLIMCASGPAVAADGAIRIGRDCSLIQITVTAPAEGSYKLQGYREFGEEAGQTNDWVAHYEAGESMTWHDKSYSDVTYRLVRKHAPVDQLVAGPITSARTGCR